MSEINLVGTDKKRVLCNGCLRPIPACICGLVQPVRSRLTLGILQHPQEVRQAKGTAQLAQKCLGCDLWVGEDMRDLTELQAWLNQRPTYLLYPPDEANPNTLSTAQLADTPGEIQVLIVDGTWRKTYKMLQMNPQLAALPRITLKPTASSAYAIRKTPNEQSLSTLEAIYTLLCQVDMENAQTYWPLKQAFDEFVAQRLAFMPSTRPGA